MTRTTGVLGLLDRFSGNLALMIDRRPVVALASFTVVYFALTGWLAVVKPLWTDEFFTLFLSRLEPPGEVWTALLTGADQHPPSFYLLPRAFHSLIGANQLSVRIPAILGYWLMSLCLYAIAARRSSPAFGFVALLAPLSTEAYRYAVEGRGYALVLGFTALALLCWLVAAEGRQRRLALSGLAISSAAAVASHYYAVFPLAAITVGEIARSMQHRKVDWPVWLAFGAGAIPVVAFARFVSSAAGWAGTFWARSSWSDVPEFYHALFEPAAVSGMVILIILTVEALESARRTDSSLRERAAYPFHELASLVTLAATPVVAVAGTMIATGAFAPRYALPAIIGISVLLAVGADAVSLGRRRTAGLLVILLSAAFWANQQTEVDTHARRTLYLAKTSGWLRANSDPALPIVVWHQKEFLALRQYAPPDIASRLVLVTNPEASLRHLGHDTVDRGTVALRPWFGSNIYDYREFIASTPSFLAYGFTGDRAWTGRDWNWLVPQLLADGARLQLLARAGDEMLFIVQTGSLMPVERSKVR